MNEIKIKIDDRLKDEFQRICAAKRVSMSAVIRELIRLVVVDEKRYNKEV